METETVALLQQYLDKYGKEGRKIYFSSSFQTQSIPLLHIVGRYFPHVPVVFIDTGFLFPETYQFVNDVAQAFGIKVITVKSSANYFQQRTESNLFLYTKDTNHCCHINKVEPIQGLIQKGDVWVSGVRRDQTSVRAQMQVEEIDEKGVVRFHPMLDWTGKDVYQYINRNSLPKHPLDSKGFVSIGCVPCTQRWDGVAANRSGRWVGSKKTECGLHVKS